MVELLKSPLNATMTELSHLYELILLPRSADCVRMSTIIFAADASIMFSESASLDIETLDND